MKVEISPNHYNEWSILTTLPIYIYIYTYIYCFSRLNRTNSVIHSVLSFSTQVLTIITIIHTSSKIHTKSFS